MKAKQYNYKQDYYYGIDYFPERFTYRNSNGVEISEFEIKDAIAKREERNSGHRGLIRYERARAEVFREFGRIIPLISKDI